MDQGGTVLRALLRERHWQKYSTFCTEYNRTALSIDSDLVDSWPSRPQLQRWLSGNMKSLPYPDHCRVLEAMFPGWTARELFSTAGDKIRKEKEQPLDQVDSLAEIALPIEASNMLGLTAAYATRADFLAARPLRDLFANAHNVRVAGLSLNAVAQHLSDSALIDSLRSGTAYKCLFLDPLGDATARRESEEGHQPGHLQRLTELNIDVLASIKARARDYGENLDMGMVDETIRFNIILVDRRFCAFQPYLPKSRGLESPTFVVGPADGGNGALFNLFDQIFESLWDARKPI